MTNKTTPPPIATRTPGMASGSGPYGNIPTGGPVEDVIVSGRPVSVPVPHSDGPPLSKDQLQDLSDAGKTTGTSPAKPGTVSTTPRGAHQTHMIVRTRDKQSFRRGGLTFTTEPQVISVEDIGEEKAKQIEAEPMLDVTRASADDVAHHTNMMASLDREHAGMSDTELRQQLKRAHEHIQKIEDENETLRNGASGADSAPKRDGQRPGEYDRHR